MGNNFSLFLKYTFRENFPPLCGFKVKNTNFFKEESVTNWISTKK